MPAAPPNPPARVVDVRQDFPELFGGIAIGGAATTTQIDGPRFYPALVRWGSANKTPPDWMLQVFYLESRLNPHIGNALGYVGLNQLASTYLRAQFGVDPTDYLTWQASEQLERVIGPWYARARAQFLGGRAPRSPGTLYALNIAPARVLSQGDSPSSVMYASPSREYQANAGLDDNHDGQITIGDFDAFMAKLTTQAPYKAARAELAKYETPPATSSTARGFLADALIALSIAVPTAATVYLVRRYKAERARERDERR